MKAKPKVKQRLNYLFWLLMPETTRLHHYLRVQKRIYEPEIKKAEEADDLEEYNSALQELNFSTEWIYGRLKEKETQYWQRKAHRYHVPVPVRQGKYWDHIKADGNDYWHLTEAGIFLVRNLIREEQKYRRESRLAYIGAFAQILAALTGIIGVLIGLLTAIGKFSK